MDLKICQIDPECPDLSDLGPDLLDLVHLNPSFISAILKLADYNGTRYVPLV